MPPINLLTNLQAQARELGIEGYEEMNIARLFKAVRTARGARAPRPVLAPDQITPRPVPAPRPPPDQITRTPAPRPRPRTQGPLLMPHLPLPTQTPAQIPPQAPIPPPRPDRPKTAAQVFMQQTPTHTQTNTTH